MIPKRDAWKISSCINSLFHSALLTVVLLKFRRHFFHIVGFATPEFDFSAGNGAYLLESTDKASTYKLNVGNLPANATAEVHFSFVCPLAPVHDGFTFTLPPTIYPSSGSYGCDLHGTIDMGEEVSQVSVLSNHALKTDTKGFSFTSEALEVNGLSSELQIGIKLKSMEPARETTNEGPQELTKPTLVIENDFSSDPTLFSAMLDFRPVFSSPVPEMSSDYEIVVLADCTGAMYGKMPKQQTALKLLAHSLPTGCKFNLISVNGSDFTSQWRTSVVLDEENMQNALWAINRLGVEVAGSKYSSRYVSGGEPKIHAALSSVFHRRDYGRNLCVFLLTAIDYSEESRQLNQLLSRNANRNMRLFCLGFGDEVDTELLNSLAFTGRGKAHFVREDDAVDSILFQQLVAAFAPRVRDIKVTWNVDASTNAKFIDQAPHRVPITASGASTTVYALFEVPVPDGIEIPKIEEDKEKKDEKEKEKLPADSVVAVSPTGSKSKISTESSPKIHKDKSSKGEKATKIPRTPSAVVASTVATAVSKGTSSTDLKSPKGTSSGATSSDADLASTSSPKIPKAKSSPKVEKPKSTAPPQATHHNTLLAGLKMPITSVVIEGLGPEDQPLKWEIPIADASFRGLSRMITATAASKVCSDYAAITKSSNASISEGEAKQKAIDISTKFQVISKFTSYVAVEERKGEAATDAMKQVELAAHGETTVQPPAIPLPPVHISYQHPLIGRQPTIPVPPMHMSPNTIPPPPPPQVFGGAVPPPPPTNGGRRHILPLKHWQPPAPAGGRGASHSLPARSLQLSYDTSSQVNDHRFASDKVKRKKEKESSSASPISPRSPRNTDMGAAAPATSAGIARDFAARDHLSSLGFALSVDPQDDSWVESPYESMMKQTPVQFKLAPPAAREQKEKAKSKDRSSSPTRSDLRADRKGGVSLDEDADWSSSSSDADDIEEELPHDIPAPPPAPGQPSSSSVSLSKKQFRSNHYTADEMVPNKSSLEMLSFPEEKLSAAPKVQFSLTRPDSWDYVQEALKNDNPASPRGPTSEQKLRIIGGTQRADGSWDLNSVAQMLQIKAKLIEDANPLATVTEKKEKKEKKKKTKTVETEAAEAPESQSKDTDEQIDASKSESKAEEKKVSDSDLWASLVVFAYLKRNFDSERNYWTFLGLKFQGLLKK